jgi:succinate dehydrogenase/fumarate reductase flavoprotein subunit
MEFVQFHPTALAAPGAPRFLLSEALRGEGGKLRNHAGEAFMHRYDPRWRAGTARYRLALDLGGDETNRSELGLARHDSSRPRFCSEVGSQRST